LKAHPAPFEEIEVGQLERLTDVKELEGYRQREEEVNHVDHE
jgi:hypothetical protein